MAYPSDGSPISTLDGKFDVSKLGITGELDQTHLKLFKDTKPLLVIDEWLKSGQRTFQMAERAYFGWPEPFNPYGEVRNLIADIELLSARQTEKITIETGCCRGWNIEAPRMREVRHQEQMDELTSRHQLKATIRCRTFVKEYEKLVRALVSTTVVIMHEVRLTSFELPNGEENPEVEIVTLIRQDQNRRLLIIARISATDDKIPE